MTQGSATPAPSADYLLHPKRGRAYDIEPSGHDNDTAPRVPARASLRRGVPARPQAIPSPLSEIERRAVEKRLNKLPLIRHLGGRFDLTSAPPAVCVAIDELKDFHRGGLGVTAVNGAAISALADCMVGAAGVVYFPGVRSGTVNLSMNFVRPLFGRTVRGCCWAMRRTSVLLFVEAVILDSSDRVCATASGLVAQVLPRRSAAISVAGDGSEDKGGAILPSAGAGAANV